MPAPMEHQQAMLREIEGIETGLAKLRGLVMQSMIEQGVPSASEVRGMPCVAEVAWLQEVPIGEAELVDASAMIPALQLNRADRGGE